MAGQDPDDVTLNTLHEDLKGGFADLKQEVQTGFADLKGEVRSGFADMKATLITGFRSLGTRESNEEMVRLLRERNRLDEERFTQLDLRIREQHFDIQQVLRAMADGQRALLEGQRLLLEGQRALHEDIRALIARLDTLIKGRGDGGSTA